MVLCVRSIFVILHVCLDLFGPCKSFSLTSSLRDCPLLSADLRLFSVCICFPVCVKSPGYISLVPLWGRTYNSNDHILHGKTKLSKESFYFMLLDVFLGRQ